MGRYNEEDILQLMREEDIQFVRMQFTDLFGQLKNVAITASQIRRALAGEIMLDGSSIQGSVRIEESDQYLRPDLNTFAVLPWRPQYGKVARLICDVYNPDGTPFEGDPRNMLKRALRQASAMGYTFNVGPELEFFLFQTDDEGKPTTRTSDEAGYFDLGPLDHGESTRREVALALEQIGIEVEASHHEVAAGQHEIDLKYTDALTAADNIMTFKLAVKTLAQKNGLHATFMPKPVRDAAGNGMHINISLFKGDSNAFYDEAAEEQLSPLARQFIAGLLKHVQGFCVLTNPLVNSYKRLTSGYEAPRYLSWSSSNRSALIRIPDPRGRGTRIELRSPDPACNPYLALAACLTAGLDGVARGLTPPPEITGNLYAIPPAELVGCGVQSLPTSLTDALKAMESDTVIMDVLGSYADRYIDGKQQEWEEYQKQISQWELDRYLTVY